MTNDYQKHIRSLAYEPLGFWKKLYANAPAILGGMIVGGVMLAALGVLLLF